MKETGGAAAGGVFFWVPWLARTAAAVNLAAAVATMMFLVRTESGSLGARMHSITANETVFRWSWGSGLLSAMAMTGVFLVLMWVLDTQYRALLQMALMIWIIGASGWVLHDLIQITVMPVLSRLFMAWPTEGLVDHILAWEHLLFRLVGVFSFTCYAISGFIYTAVMFRTDRFPNGMARYSFAVWCFVLMVAVSVRWAEELLPWLTACTLLMLVPWFWRLGGLIPLPNRP